MDKKKFTSFADRLRLTYSSCGWRCFGRVALRSAICICAQRLPGPRARQQRHTIDINPKRGVIFDRNMHPLAMSVPVQSAFAVPAEIEDRIDGGAATFRARGRAGGCDRGAVSGVRSFWIKRKLPPAKSEAVSALNLKGIYLQEENQRYYPKRDLARARSGICGRRRKGTGRH